MPINKVGPRSRSKRSRRALYKSKSYNSLVQSGLVNNMTHGAIFSNKINQRYNGPFSHAKQKQNKILKTFNSWIDGYRKGENKEGDDIDDVAASLNIKKTQKAIQDIQQIPMHDFNASGSVFNITNNVADEYTLARKKLKFRNVSNGDNNTEWINELETYFDNFSISNKVEYYSFNKNTPNATIYLTQRSFVNGTVRITIPGYYKLDSDITFHPNSENNFRPTPNQIISGQYPMGTDGAYHLGFFAAITIETEGVILDMNDHVIKQSKEHGLMQRFYANIELANSPFIPKQGPSSFSNESNYMACSNVIIKNGSLGRSSHHGIHGNSMKNIWLDNLDISDFEVAGIALNGSENTILSDINVHDISEKIPVLSRFSQSIFIKTFLNKVKKEHPNAVLNLRSGSKNINTIINELETAINYTKNEILNERELDDSNFFKNSSGLYDGNAYGILLNINGVAINHLLTERNPEMKGNKNIFLKNITIDNIITEPIEIIGLSLKPEPNARKQHLRITKANKEPAFGGKSQAGPIGDILEIEKIVNVHNRYKENILANAQLIIAKYLNSDEMGTSNIAPEIISWAESDTSIIDVMNRIKLSFTYGGDSMGHIMKGNLGLLVSAAENINIEGLTINKISSKNNKVGSSIFIDNVQDEELKKGLLSCGCCITASNNVYMKNETITNITSDNGEIEHNKEINSIITHL